ncbi:uncharacterized protein DS421_16g554930 [Arachis hypogaea]|nr:uncharacterized protein DS421_16g554930 [Arachis hypogaea]
MPMKPQVAGLADQPFIMVPNSNYVPPSTTTTSPPIGQQPSSTAMLPPATDVVTPASSHRSDQQLMPLHHLPLCS